jgi:CheY-like chemotaxis protein/anti-sigma regulatory factor (Ser/Thr protein kinase)
VVRLVARSLPPRVRLVVDVSDELPPLGADPVELERAVLNLVNNARDAVGAKGTVTIRAVADTLAAEGRERRSDLLDRGQRPAVRIEVVDDGTGMDQVTRARAFEPMFTTKPDGQGTGLGLPSVLAFVTATDGALHLSSEPDVGTTVTLIVPVEVPSDVEVEGTRTGPVGGAKVLLVDPGEHTRRVIARMLDSAGYRVTACRDGEEALALLEQERVDLLLTELVLAGIGGSRLIETARQRVPGLAVVVLASAEAPRSLDGDPLLVKPFSQTRLLQTVARVLGQR